MEEYNSTPAEVIEAESGEQENVVDSRPENHDFDLVEDNATETKAETETEEKTDDGQDDAVDRQQSKDDNHSAKLARLKAERDAKRQIEALQSQIDREIRESGAINPYTEKPFQSKQEFLDYGRKVKEAEQKARAERDGRTVEEIVEEDNVREIIRKTKESKENPKQKSREEFMLDDLIDFTEKHPEVDIAKLDGNINFRKFAGSRYGRESLSSLYESYAEFVKTTEDSVKHTVKADTRNARSTGSGNAGGDRLTASQRRALDEWNDANPDMKMTPSEYLHR